MPCESFEDLRAICRREEVEEDDGHGQVLRAWKVLTQLLRPLTYRASPQLLPLPAPPSHLFLHHIGLSVDMSTTVVACQSTECLNGHPPSKMECPTCNKYAIYPLQRHLFVLILLLRLGIKGSLFCSQECFKASCEHQRCCFKCML